MRDGHRLTRRGALRRAGGVLAGINVLNLDAQSAAETIRTNVGYSEPSGLAAVERAATELIWEFEFGAATALLPSDVLETLGDREDIRYVERDPTIEAIGLADGGPTLPWGVDRIDAEAARAAGHTGGGADVAVVDTGIDLTHGDLPNATVGVQTIGGVVVPGGQDDNGHGSHCAGVIGAADNGHGVVGVAPDATLHPVKAITATGTGFTSDAAAGVRYVANQGWDVVNLSIGGGHSRTMAEACEYADTNGVLIVAASGNDGSPTVGHPATHDTVVSVGATDRDDQLAGFTSGTTDTIDYLAPGVGIHSTFLRGYVTLDGTSMAAPHVAGVAALVAAADGQDSLQAQEGLIDAAASVGADSSDDGTGSGSPGLGGSGFGIDAFGL